MNNSKNPHTESSLIADLKKSGIDPRGTLFVHSSVKSVGECKGSESSGDTILDAFIEYMREGLLIFPTHTWMEVGYKIDKYPNRKVYDPLTSKSCVGVLTNLFMKRKGVIRSLHPTHSVAAIGRNAADYTNGEQFTRTPCSREGCYGKLYDLNAQILFLGCDLSKNTFLHFVEEWNNIPDRLNKTQQELYTKSGGELIPVPQYRHVEGDVSVNYVKVESDLIKSGAAVYCKIGDAHCVLCDAVKMADLVGLKLKYNPDLFGNDN
jgi:aminoglycoside 3-N-acetyltransferase